MLDRALGDELVDALRALVDALRALVDALRAVVRAVVFGLRAVPPPLALLVVFRVVCLRVLPLVAIRSPFPGLLRRYPRRGPITHARLVTPACPRSARDARRRATHR